MKQRLISILKWTERYTKTDMVYLASGTLWSGVNSVVVSALALLTSIFFARYLTREAYGTYQFILSIAGLLAATTLTGMNAAVTRAVARGHEGELKRSISHQLVWGFIPFLLGLCVAGWYFYYGNQSLAWMFVFIAVFLPIQNTFNTWGAYTGGKKLFRIGTYYGLANNIITSAAILLTVYVSHSFVWVIIANFGIASLSNFIIYNILIRHVPPNDSLDPDAIRFGNHLSVMGILGVFAAQFDSLVIFHFVGSVALATYSFATLIPEKIAGMLKYLPNIAMPKLSGKSEREVRDILSKKLWVFILLIAAVALAYASAAPWIYSTFFPKYDGSIAFTQVYSLSFFSLVALMVQTALTAQQKTKELYQLNIVMPFARIGLMALLMYEYGIWGLLWAQIISNFVSIAFQLIFLWRSPATEEVPPAQPNLSDPL